ncbi:MAG: aminodeoxychorismate/anthranilate synthase component II [Planctomycetota bacterium]
MILLIDNYDSFTYNLVQRIGELLVANGQDPDAPEGPDGLGMKVVRNDKITPAEAEALEPSHVIVSPGPCTPKEAGVSCEIIEAFAGKVPLLGVCLGHQSIGHRFGMTVQRHAKLMHGKTSQITHDSQGLFAGVPNPFTAMRYHSLIVTEDSLDTERFEMSSWCDDSIDGQDVRVVMGMRAKPGAFAGDAPVEGLQFHPESFMTPDGPTMLANFLGLPRPKHAIKTVA